MQAQQKAMITAKVVTKIPASRPEANQPQEVILSQTKLPQPQIIIQLDFTSIIQSFQDLRYIGELRQRWTEIKRLQVNPLLRVSSI